MRLWALLFFLSTPWPAHAQLFDAPALTSFCASRPNRDMPPGQMRTSGTLLLLTEEPLMFLDRGF